jgi:homospermidine synthase
LQQQPHQSSEGMDTTTEKWLFKNDHKKKKENKNMFLLPVPACLPGEQF